MSTADTFKRFDESDIDAELEREDACAELENIEAEERRRRWADDPREWARERLSVFLWSKQVAILESVRDNRRTAVPSCHEAGKSFNAAILAAWWIDTHAPGEAFVVTTAPTGRQVRAILWREIGRAHSKGALAGHTNQTEWFIPVTDPTTGITKDELVAFGVKPNDYDPTAFQGIHARYVLVIFDEACGIPKPLWVAASSLIANDAGRFLAIGNPDDPQTEFFESCKLGSAFNVVRISAFDTPAFTGEKVPHALYGVLVGRTYVEEERAKLAKDWFWVDKDGKPTTARKGARVVPPENTKPEEIDPVWSAKILGQFPHLSGMLGLIPKSWIEDAQERTLEPEGVNRLGVDVGGGGDTSTTCHRRGPVARIISSDRNPNTMQTRGKVVDELRTTGADVAHVDRIGIGAGIVDMEDEHSAQIVGINVGEAAVDTEKFGNLRAEFWWGIRQRFEDGDIDIDPKDKELAGELENLRFRRTPRGQILIESKDDAKRRGVQSPNRADSLMLAYSEPPIRETKPVKKAKLLW